MLDKMNVSNKQGVTKIHNVRFYNLSPRSINCLAYNKQKGKLALSRNDASFEIWDLNYAPILEKTFSGDVDYSSTETICWVGDRLFSAGLSCEVIEWDLLHLRKKHSQSVTGNAVWCLEVNQQGDCMAVGTEEGYLNLFEIVEEGLMYKKLFDKQEGRILCCKFDASGDFIVTGSMDVIRIWSTKTGSAIHKMTMGRNERKRETTVWSLQVLKDFTIICGDSRGCVTIWDGKVGTQVQLIHASKADILATAVNEDENILAVSGLDSLIKIFSLTNIKKEDQQTKLWVKFLQKSVHDHDVRALACAGTKIVSGGIDGYLGISSYSKSNSSFDKYGPFLQNPFAAVSSVGRFLLLRYVNYLELWRLGVAEDKVQINDDEEDSRKMLMLEEGPEKHVELRSYKDETIVCSSISPNGCFIIYSTASTIRVFLLTKNTDHEEIKLSRIKDLPEQFTPCNQIVFSYDSETLFLVKINRQIDIFRILSSGEIDYLETIDASKSIKDVIHLSTISPCGRYFVAAGICRTISVWIKGKRGNWQHYINLPTYVATTTAIAVHYNRPSIVATFSDGKIFEYDLEEMRFTCSSNQMFVSKMDTHCVNGIVLDPRNDNAIILHNDLFLFVLLKYEETNTEMNKSNKALKIEEISTKNTKNTSSSHSNSINKLKLKFKSTYEHFVHLSWLTEEELVVVGVNPIALIEQLPAVFYRKRFGAT